jgi:CRP-like cAMP-binding protein
MDIGWAQAQNPMRRRHVVDVAKPDFGRISAVYRKIERISHLDEADRQYLATLPRILRNFEADSDVVREGDMPDHSCIVQEGYLTGSRIVSDGRRQVVALHIPGDIPDLHVLHFGFMDHTLTAITQCRLSFMHHDVIRHACDTHPKIARALWRCSLVDAAVQREWIVSLGRFTARERTARLLCELVLRHRAAGLSDGKSCPLPFTQIEIADALGLTSVSISRILTDMKSEGLFRIERRHLTILDWHRLTAEGHFDPSYLHLPIDPVSAMAV